MIDTIKIGALEYKVTEIERLHDINDGQHVNLHGQIKWIESEIELCKEQTNDLKIVTLWHEILHGIIWNCGLEDNEPVINALSHGIVEILRDNPDLISLTVT